MLLYQFSVFVILGVLFAIFLWNLLVMKRVDPAWKPSEFPFVSVLVPVRNEERTIEPCLRSLLSQTYPRYEILVLDDQSEDRTPQILGQIAASSPRFRILRGQNVPPDWQGKCFACHQLASQAQGELLLFTDADTVHQPTSLMAAVSAMQATHADIYTLLADLRMGSSSEKVFLPLIPFTALAHFPLALMMKGWFSGLGLANGQFLLFKRGAYQALGGHAAFRQSLIEDVSMARRALAQRLRLVFQDGSRLVSCRMYQNLGEIVEGFTKNTFAGFGYSLPFILAASIFSLAAYVLPYLFLLLGMLLRLDFLEWLALPAAQILLALAMRILLAWRMNYDFGPIPTHPVAVLIFVGICLNSVNRTYSGRGVSWKGRNYRFRL